MMSKRAWDILIFIVGFLTVFALDRWTKIFFSSQLALNESIVVIPRVLHMSLVHNTGIAFGLFKDCGFISLLIPVILIGVLIYFFCFYSNQQSPLSRFYVIALSLIVGGAIGNLYDRLMLGYVVDFIDFRIWPVFNIADSAITCGAAIIVLQNLPKINQSTSKG